MTNLDIFLMQVACLAVDELAKYAHQTIDLTRGTRPILGRKGIQRQVAHPLLGALAHDPTDVLGAGTMPCQARQPTSLSPAPIAIHDDRDMARNARTVSRLRRHLNPHKQFWILDYRF